MNYTPITKREEEIAKDRVENWIAKYLSVGQFIYDDRVKTYIFRRGQVFIVAFDVTVYRGVCSNKIKITTVNKVI